MARFRWTEVARLRFETLIEWQERERGVEQAARVATDIREAIRRAAATPELYPWVGSVHSELADLPHSFRRVLTRPPHHTIYYRYDEAEGWINILELTGSGQTPPSRAKLA